ncbi:VC0807 family protein [Streptomyces hesseae]|uniref:VC0807 family protein n=1 Tax=Streptomyces hesseae TaxID=3075519 RepID=A0ABU2SST8_9ACTN|nr:VC0807 family protein [Streptomyces sp. DSM 40473]MDT0450989.1 VC0807 family protein [Streptomyces sp. DSM 40473]
MQTQTLTTTPAPAGERRALAQSLTPLVVDALVPMAGYYVLTDGFGMGTVAALAWTSVLPALRSVWSLVKDRRLNGLATLMLVVNAVGLALSTVTGDARLMLAKDSAGSGAIGAAVLVSVFAGRPMMTAGLKPWITKGGDPAKTAAWDRLSYESARFRRAERRFSLVWGLALLTESTSRVVAAYTLPAHTVVWLGNVLAGAAVLVAIVVTGAVAVDPMEKMVEAEVTPSA